MGEKADADFVRINALADQVFEGEEDGGGEERFKFVFSRMEKLGHRPRKLIEWDDAEPTKDDNSQDNGWSGFTFASGGSTSSGAKHSDAGPAKRSASSSGGAPAKPERGMGQYS